MSETISLTIARSIVWIPISHEGEEIALSAPRKGLDPEVLFRVPNVIDYDVSPRDDLVALSWDKSGQPEIYKQELGTEEFKIVTRGSESKIGPCFAPGGGQLAFAQDYQGDEKFDIFLLNASDEEAWNLTPGTKETIYPHTRWSPDGRRLAFASNREGKFSIYTIPASGGRPERVSDHRFSDSDPEWSPDGRQLAFSALVTAQENGVFIAPSQGGEPRRLTQRGEPIDADSPDWSPDGKSIAFASDHRGGSDIGIWEAHSESVEWITDTRYECYAPKWSPDGQRLAYLINKDGNVSIAVRNQQNQATDILQVEAGVHSQLDFGSSPDTMFFVFSGSRHPPDLWKVDLKGGEFHQLTNSLPSTIDRSLFATGTTVRYRSNDGMEVPALLYLPKAYDRNRPGPSLVYIHGGPTAQFRNDWNPAVQHLVDKGYIVIAPNYRGSTGYGRRFKEANRFVLGEKDLEDVIAAADFLTSEGYADPRKIGVMGGSYGGYLTMCAVTKFPDHWAVGAAMVPFLNWFTEIENEREDLQSWDRENMGDPKADYDRFRNASPIFFIDRIETPVQLIAGGNDPRCPVSETKQAQAELQRLGKTFDLIIYEDEGHIFRKLSNRVDALKRRAAFFDKHLKT